MFDKLLLLCLILFHCIIISKSNISLDEKIIGGRPSYIQQFPYLALLGITISKDEYCGGTIIGKYWVLTAAHCVYDKSTNYIARPDQIRVIVGRSTFSGFDGQEYQVQQVIVNEQYSYDPACTNDIALLQITQPFVFSNTVTTTRLASGQVADGTWGMVMGWGQLANGQTGEQLQSVPTRTFNIDKCQQIWDVPSSNICTLNSPGRGICFGDSGGPLMINGVQYGIACGVPVPCADGRPDIFTSIPVYRSWIQQKTGI
ncbi:chymotrypsin-1-like [Oppia nitens]|uniref:chymotrypsin-1-like n=1 Tax=Oppia nitens TaxID=1686743 RepID=UPI0023DCC014|nr:chymotrypsin-1-like [Oppia nitens]